MYTCFVFLFCWYFWWRDHFSSWKMSDDIFHVLASQDHDDPDDPDGHVESDKSQKSLNSWYSPGGFFILCTWCFFILCTWWLVKAVLDFLFFFGGCLLAKFNWARSISETHVLQFVFCILYFVFCILYVAFCILYSRKYLLMMMMMMRLQCSQRA